MRNAINKFDYLPVLFIRDAHILVSQKRSATESFSDVPVELSAKITLLKIEKQIIVN